MAPMNGYSRYLRQVSRNLKNARIASGLTQIEVHARTGLAYRHYQNLEAGRVNLTLETLYRLAKTFEVTVEILVRENGSVDKAAQDA